MNYQKLITTAIQTAVIINVGMLAWYFFVTSKNFTSQQQTELLRLGAENAFDEINKKIIRLDESLQKIIKQNKTKALQDALAKKSHTNGSHQFQDNNQNISVSEQLDPIKLQHLCKEAIVKVLATSADFNWLEPYQTPDQAQACGSGFFIDDQGRMLTNYHVVGNALRVQIQTSTLGQEKFDCEVVGVCPDRDLALIKIKENDFKKLKSRAKVLKHLEFGDSDEIQKGWSVCALGFPLGVNTLKATVGVISGWQEIAVGERGETLSCLETTAPINPGSSGGPAVDKNGKVIGLNFAGIDKAQNIGYVLPINEMKSAIKAMHENKLILKPYLGIIPQDSSEDLAEYLNNPTPNGLYVRKILKNSLAEKIGIKEGDMIYEFNDSIVDNHGDVNVAWRGDKISCSNIFGRLDDGDDISFVIYRNGEKIILNSKFDSEISTPIRFFYPGYEKIDYEIFGGFVVMELTLNHIMLLLKINPSLIMYAKPENVDKTVLLITSLQPTSEAHRHGLVDKGKVLTEINGKKVSSLTSLREEISSSFDKKFVTIKSDDHSFTALSMQDILANEERLSKTYKYKPEHSTTLKYIINSKSNNA